MEKKITAQGPKTRKSYTVTLPIDWIRKEGIDESMIVNLNEVGNKIIISSNSEKKKDATIALSRYEKTISKVIVSLYKAGVDEILIKFKQGDDISKIIDTIEKYLIGYEIVNQEENSLFIKDITVEAEDNFETLVRRIFTILTNYAKTDNPSQIETMDKNLRRFTNYATRTLVKKGHANFRVTPVFYGMLEKMRSVGKDLRWITKSKKFSEGYYDDFIKEIEEILRAAVEILFKFDKEKFAKTQYETFELIHKTIDLDNEGRIEDVHKYNIARTLNNLISDVMMVCLHEIEDE